MTIRWDDTPWGESCELFVADGHVTVTGPVEVRRLVRLVAEYGDGLSDTDAVDAIRHAEWHHGWEVHAPPFSEWWGGTMVAWAERGDHAPPDGWAWSNYPHDCECDDDPPEGAVCIADDRRPWRDAVAAMSPEVVAVGIEEGDEWLCRVVRPVTLMVVR